MNYLLVATVAVLAALLSIRRNTPEEQKEIDREREEMLHFWEKPRPKIRPKDFEDHQS